MPEGSFCTKKGEGTPELAVGLALCWELIWKREGYVILRGRITDFIPQRGKLRFGVVTLG